MEISTGAVTGAATGAANQVGGDGTMMLVALDAFGSVTVGFVVFFLGAFLTRKVAFLRNYNIPEPVSGGFAIAIVAWLLFLLGIRVEFDMAVRDALLVIFFATIGLNARFADLLQGGRILVTLLALTIAYMVLQNAVALVGVTIFDLPRSVAVLIGSASLIGGHGTAIAWGPTIQETTGFEAAAEIGVASATLGLIFAAIIGGPIAKLLIERNQLEAETDGDQLIGMPHGDQRADEHRDVNHVNIMRVLFTVHISIILGFVLQELFSLAGLKLPLFVPVMLAAIILSNTVPYLLPGLTWPARTRSLAIVSDYALSVFLAMSLMSMQLWVLADLGLPLLVILAGQILATTAFVLLLFFRVMGANYTSAVLSAGFAGFALGATPTAIANMTSVAKRYGPAPLAFVILPLVSAFFVDLANAVIIQFFIGL
ncbi:MAG: sodium/glutamate symporter [Pseudomonadota bacterium]